MPITELIPYALSFAFVFYITEHIIGYVGFGFYKRFMRVASKVRLGDIVEFRLRIIETLASVYIAFIGSYLTFAHLYYGLDVMNAHSSAMWFHTFFMLSYFVYHLIASHDIKRQLPPIMPFHHLMMILLTFMALLYNQFYFYVMLAAIPSASAALRNWVWFTKRTSCEACRVSSITQTCLYCLFQIVPVLLCIIHVAYFYDTVPAEKAIIFGSMGLVISIMAIYIIRNSISRLFSYLINLTRKGV